MEERGSRGPRPLQRYKVIDGQPWCFCSSHDEFFPCEQFTKSRTFEHGYEYRCKSCQYNQIPSKYSTRGISRQNELDIVKKFLVSCGYNPESTIPVHEQFLIKHDL